MACLTLIKVLLITQVCQSLTVIQPIYNNDNNYYKPKQIEDLRKEVASVPDTSIQNPTRKEYGLRKSPKLAQDLSLPTRKEIPKLVTPQPYAWALRTPLLTRLEPYRSGMISNILSRVQSNIAVYHEQPAYSNIYPVQYQYHNPYHRAWTRLPSFNEPVTAATLNTEVLHEPKEIRKQQQPLLNYNNKIYHVNKAISNQSFTQQQYPPFVRKQRNSNANHYDDDKLIEHNFTEIRADNKDIDYAKDFNGTTAASLKTIKQPSAATDAASSSSSHEIRYLHDIFLNYPKYHHVNYGHIDLSPHLFQKRFESLKAGNRYKGEVIWLDNTGGYSQHYWNMAQGKL